MHGEGGLYFGEAEEYSGRPDTNLGFQSSIPWRVQSSPTSTPDSLMIAQGQSFANIKG